MPRQLEAQPSYAAVGVPEGHTGFDRRRKQHGANAAGIERIRQARTIHGGRSAEMLELRREMAILKRAARRMIAAVW